MRRRLLAGLVALLVLARPLAAGASYYLAATPDYYGSVWFRIGFSSEGRFVFGVAGDLLPGTVGVEISPGSRLGLVRATAGVKWGFLFPNTCSFFPRASAEAVAAFGPDQPIHVGMRLGAHFEITPMPDADTSFPKLGDAAAYRFTWLPRAGTIHEGAFEFGPYWAPHVSCESD